MLLSYPIYSLPSMENCFSFYRVQRNWAVINTLSQLKPKYDTEMDLFSNNIRKACSATAVDFHTQRNLSSTFCLWENLLRSILLSFLCTCVYRTSPTPPSNRVNPRRWSRYFRIVHVLQVSIYMLIFSRFFYSFSLLLLRHLYLRLCS